MIFLAHRYYYYVLSFPRSCGGDVGDRPLSIRKALQASRQPKRAPSSSGSRSGLSVVAFVVSGSTRISRHPWVR